MTVTGLDSTLERALDLAGVFVFALSGASLAARKRFDVVGTAKALDHSLGVLPSVLLGVTTAVGGGMLRDVLAREVPSVFKADSALYAIPAALGSGVTAVVWSRHRFGAFAAICIVVSVLVVRVLAMHRGWRAPTARDARE